MLERIEPEIGEIGSLFMAEDAKDRAFVVKLIRHDKR